MQAMLTNMEQESRVTLKTMHFRTNISAENDTMLIYFKAFLRHLRDRRIRHQK